MKRIIYDYENAHIVGRAKHKFPLAKIIIAIIVVSLLVALIYVFFFRKTSHESESKEYFVVVSGCYEDENDAKKDAETIKSKGGGGYIINESEYEVIVSVYKSQEDALSVAKRYGYEVKSTGIFAIKANLSNVSISKEAVRLAKLPEILFEDVYDASVSFDKSEISLDAALHAVSLAQETLSEFCEKLDEIKNGEDKLIIKIKEMYSRLDNALIRVVDGGSVSSRLKFCLIEVTYIYKNFLNAIS